MKTFPWTGLLQVCFFGGVFTNLFMLHNRYCSVVMIQCLYLAYSNVKQFTELYCRYCHCKQHALEESSTENHAPPTVPDATP